MTARQAMAKASTRRIWYLLMEVVGRDAPRRAVGFESKSVSPEEIHHESAAALRRVLPAGPGFVTLCRLGPPIGRPRP